MKSYLSAGPGRDGQAMRLDYREEQAVLDAALCQARHEKTAVVTGCR